jgi:hypothetical protein
MLLYLEGMGLCLACGLFTGVRNMRAIVRGDWQCCHLSPFSDLRSVACLHVWLPSCVFMFAYDRQQSADTWAFIGVVFACLFQFASYVFLTQLIQSSGENAINDWWTDFRFPARPGIFPLSRANQSTCAPSGAFAGDEPAGAWSWSYASIKRWGQQCVLPNHHSRVRLHGITFPEKQHKI